MRRSAFTHRYDTDTELALLHELWPLVNQRKNLFLPTKKAIGYRETKSGRHTREYDNPRTPADRVKTTGILLPTERRALDDLTISVDLVELIRRIQRIQEELIRLPGAKTYSQGHAA